ncbi:MAG: DUF47 domain-containing protein [Longimicrobiales bacterium]
MTGRIRRLWRDLIGRGDAVLIDMLLRQTDIAFRAARILSAAHGRGEAGTDVIAAIERLEHEGDDQRGVLLAELARALSTPIDREDLFELSRALDDVVDGLLDFAIEARDYGVGAHPRFVPLLDALAHGLEQLEHAIRKLYGGAASVPTAARAAKRANATRDAYHHAMSVLLREDLTIHTVRQRELLRRLDVTGLRLGEAADALTFGALKRG